MHRNVLPFLLVLALVLVGLAQFTTPAASEVRGPLTIPLYAPIVLKPAEPTEIPTVTATVTPTLTSTEVPATPTPTSTEVPATATPTVTSTPSNVGNGVYKSTNTQYYPNYNGTFMYGFVRFLDGAPAFGGPDNFHVYISFNGNTIRSSDLDGSGFYQIPINGFPATPIRAAGEAWVTVGRLGEERQISEKFAFDTNNGTCWQMDFRECSESDPDPVCQYQSSAFVVNTYEVTSPGPVPQGGTCPP